MIEQLLTDLLQLVHGTLKKLVPPEPVPEEKCENADGETDAEARAALIKKNAPG
jgi:hypothetical protein